MSVSCCSNFATLVCLDELRRHIHREREAREKAERQSATLQRGKGTVVSGRASTPDRSHRIVLRPETLKQCKMYKNVNVVYSECALGYPAVYRHTTSNNLKQIVQIKHNKLKIQTGRGQTSWLFYKAWWS